MLTSWAYKLACGILSVAISFSSVAASDQDKESKQSTAAGTVVRISEGALEREAVSKVEPIYPPIAKAARASGDVKVEVVIDEMGKVLSARIVSGHPLLRGSALAAARQWTFKPAPSAKETAKLTAVLTFHFELGDKTDSRVAKREPSPDPAEEFYLEGQDLSSQDRYEEAIVKYREALRLKPDYVLAHHNLGQAYLKTNRYDEAEKSCAQAVRSRGEELGREGKGERDPIYQESMVCLGLAESYLRKFDEAIKHFRKVSELDKEMADVRVFLGTVLNAKGDKNAAVIAFKESVAIKPTSTAYFLLGEIYLELNQFKEAVDSYRQCLELENGPYTSLSHYGLGMAYLKLGDKRSAMNEYHALKKNNDPLLAEQLFREINK